MKNGKTFSIADVVALFVDPIWIQGIVCIAGFWKYRCQFTVFKPHSSRETAICYDDSTGGFSVYEGSPPIFNLMDETKTDRDCYLRRNFLSLHCWEGHPFPSSVVSGAIRQGNRGDYCP